MQNLRKRLLELRDQLMELRNEAIAAVDVINEIDPTDTDKIKAAMEYSKRRIPQVDEEIARIREETEQIAKKIKSL